MNNEFSHFNEIVPCLKDIIDTDSDEAYSDQESEKSDRMSTFARSFSKFLRLENKENQRLADRKEELSSGSLNRNAGDENVKGEPNGDMPSECMKVYISENNSTESSQEHGESTIEESTVPTTSVTEETVVDPEKARLRNEMIINGHHAELHGPNGSILLNAWVKGSRKKSLSLFMRSSLNDDRCPYCRRSFNSRKALEQHLLDTESHKVWLCCGRPFLTKASRKTHRKNGNCGIDLSVYTNPEL